MAGDIDMVLHFSTDQTGLTAVDTEGCVKGRFTASGQSFKFFGCDGIVIRPDPRRFCIGLGHRRSACVGCAA